MKQQEIELYGVYLARVSGRVVRVKVEQILEREGNKYMRAGTSYKVKNLATGRTTYFRSAAKFRSRVTTAS